MHINSSFWELAPKGSSEIKHQVGPGERGGVKRGVEYVSVEVPVFMFRLPCLPSSGFRYKVHRVYSLHVITV